MQPEILLFYFQMAKRINQETFDDVVKENISEFGMGAQEAIDDAVEQFVSQVNLFNYICNILLSIIATRGRPDHDCMR